MDATTRALVSAETERFYTACADSFAATRQHAWPGWERVLDVAEWADLVSHAEGTPLRVLDVGSGPWRFERFLAARGIPFTALCLDQCEAFEAPPVDVTFKAVDVQAPGALTAATSGKTFDLAVIFALLHHVPGQAECIQLVRDVLASVRPGGLCALSLWSFEHDPRLAKKATATTERFLQDHPEATLERGDYLLGWQDQTTYVRFCHSFSSADQAQLIDAVSDLARTITTFKADGKTGDLNRYVILERR